MFESRRAVVTGARRGIRAAIAERLAAEGAHAVITAWTLDKHDHLAGSLQEKASRLAQYGRKVSVVAADLSKDTDRVRMISEAAAALKGPIEILVNNAAAAIYGPVENFPTRAI